MDPLEYGRWWKSHSWCFMVTGEIQKDRNTQTLKVCMHKRVGPGLKSKLLLSKKIYLCFFPKITSKTLNYAKLKTKVIKLKDTVFLVVPNSLRLGLTEDMS